MKHAAIFFDADVLIAGSASSTGASFLLLQLCELDLLQGLTSEQVVDECRRNLQARLPAAVTFFEELVEQTLTVYSNPADEDLTRYRSMADEKDLPILSAAVLHGADYLFTFNTRHFFPDASVDLTICKPGELLQSIRQLLNRLAGE